MTVYAVSPLAQNAEVDAFCFKECGQIIIGGIEIEGAPFCPCRTTLCRHEVKIVDLGKAKFAWGYEQVIVRKLRPLLGDKLRKEMPHD